MFHFLNKKIILLEICKASRLIFAFILNINLNNIETKIDRFYNVLDFTRSSTLNIIYL